MFVCVCVYISCVLDFQVRARACVYHIRYVVGLTRMCGVGSLCTELPLHQKCALCEKGIVSKEEKRSITMHCARERLSSDP